MNNRNTKRRAFTLLELIVSTAILAALTTSCMVIVRTSYTAWQRHAGDHAQRQSGLEVLQHVVRQIRQAKAVVAIDSSGSLSLLDQNNNILVWDHNAGTQVVLYGIGTATEVLATGVKELAFLGYKVNGSEATTDPGLIHLVKCTTKVDVTRPAITETVTTSIHAWLRAW